MLVLNRCNDRPFVKQYNFVNTRIACNTYNARNVNKELQDILNILAYTPTSTPSPTPVIKKLDLSLYKNIQDLYSMKYTTWVSTETFNKNVIGKEMHILYREYIYGRKKVVSYYFVNHFSKNIRFSTEIVEIQYNNILYQKCSWNPYSMKLDDISKKMIYTMIPCYNDSTIYLELSILDVVSVNPLLPNEKIGFGNFLKHYNNSLQMKYCNVCDLHISQVFMKRFTRNNDRLYMNDFFENNMYDYIKTNNIFVDNRVIEKYVPQTITYSTNYVCPYSGINKMVNKYKNDDHEYVIIDHFNTFISQKIEPIKCGITYSTTYITNNYYNGDENTGVTKYTQTTDDKIKEEIVLNNNTNNLVSTTIENTDIDLDNIIGYKKVYCDYNGQQQCGVLEVRIPKGARIASDGGPKYRCDQLVPTAFYLLQESSKTFTHTHIDECYSGHDNDFKYYIDKLAYVNDFDSNMNKVCTSGLHYFLSRSACVNYINSKYADYEFW